MFKKLVSDYGEVFGTRKARMTLMAGLLFFAVAIGIQNLSLRYVGQVTTIAVPDLILDHIPTLDIDSLIIDAVLLVTAGTVILAVLRPRQLVFGLKVFSLFIIIRAVLISLTHLGANPHQLHFSPHDFAYGIYNFFFNTTNDFFFSAHTGAPFLVALIFWDERKIRSFYLFITLLFGASVLAAHIHYSIDVVAAPFMTYGIYHAAQELFTQDYAFSQKS